MKEKWSFTVEEDENSSDDAVVFDVGDMIAAVSLMSYLIPNGEAELNAENNYMWPDAVKGTAPIPWWMRWARKRTPWKRVNSTPSWWKPATVRNMSPAFIPVV